MGEVRKMIRWATRGIARRAVVCYIALIAALWTVTVGLLIVRIRDVEWP
jgi:hypothetical protein